MVSRGVDADWKWTQILSGGCYMSSARSAPAAQGLGVVSSQPAAVPRRRHTVPKATVKLVLVTWLHTAESSITAVIFHSSQRVKQINMAFTLVSVVPRVILHWEETWARRRMVWILRCVFHWRASQRPHYSLDPGGSAAWVTLPSVHRGTPPQRFSDWSTCLRVWRERRRAGVHKSDKHQQDSVESESLYLSTSKCLM